MQHRVVGVVLQRPPEDALRLAAGVARLQVRLGLRFELLHVGLAFTHLARDASAIDWCLKSIATGKTFWAAWSDLASAYAWRGQKDADKYEDKAGFCKSTTLKEIAAQDYGDYGD